MKKRIYFNEYNLLMGSGGIVYLPFVSGILSAYIKTSKLVRQNFEVMPFIFVPTTPDAILSEISEPSIVCFSISMWNEQLSLAVAKLVKDKYPHALIVFGGAQCPHQPEEYMNLHGFIDVCVRAEGEDAFLKIVESYADGNFDFSNIPNVAYRKSGKIIINSEVPNYDRSLDGFPSPYLSGEFEYLLSKPNHGYQAIVETNRGCPFLCTFCYWGKGGNNTKYRFRSLETVFAELEYLSDKKVEYIFNADSNFGMHQRDYEIALKLIELKKNKGYPEKFRTCWGKNTSERIFKIASLLQLNGLDKGVTLARQSNSEEVLLNIKRDNIKLEAYEFLEKNFNKLQVPIYAELIQGLPGETLASWKKGINEMLCRGLNNQLFIYQAEVYPNTELGSKEYQEKYKIKTTKIKLNEIHCSPRGSDWVPEFQHIVTQTYSMNNDDWKAMSKFALVTMLMHSMKAGVYILAYINKRFHISYESVIDKIISSEKPFLKSIMEFFDSYSANLLKGEGRGLISEKFSDVYLEPEEIALLTISENKKLYFREILDTLAEFIPNEFKVEFEEVVKFQLYLIPEYLKEDSAIEVRFNTNVPQYCYSIFNNLDVDIISAESSLVVYQEGFLDRHEFTKKKLIWARKSGTILWSTDYERELKNNMKVSFNIEDYGKEKTFSISMFDEKHNKFEKFNSIKNILIKEA